MADRERQKAIKKLRDAGFQYDFRQMSTAKILKLAENADRDCETMFEEDVK